MTLLPQLRIDPDFNHWRTHARRLLTDGIAPDQVELLASEADPVLSLGLAPTLTPNPAQAIPRPSVPAAFLALAQTVACHRDPTRWQLLYRVLWRLQIERTLLSDELDPDIALLRRMHHQVARDLHKMHAFLRFCLVEVEPDSSQPAAPREQYVAWYRAEHRILTLAVPFFTERFAVMRWTILTDYASASWDPETRSLTWGPGVPRSEAPAPDQMQDIWRTYYGSIFNPARLNTRAMKAEMPVRYWSTLPEIDLLPTLLTQASQRTEAMILHQQSQQTNPSMQTESFVPTTHTLPILREAIPQCRGCELYKHATQPVFGVSGNRSTDGTVSTRGTGNPAAHSASLMLIGEQPGDEEDLRGEPFVGPAGRLLHTVLDRLMAEQAFDPQQLYITNAVKHFKFVQRGKRRIHESPRLSEVAACRPWLLAELDAVRPNLVLCLGATAAKSLLGARFALMHDRGKLVESPYTPRVLATIHPSAILRAEGEKKLQLEAYLQQDLTLALNLARNHSAEAPVPSA